jgi:hypothetical protein
MTSFFDWIKKFQKIASISMAVILLAIGSGMVISSALKLYVFNFESSRHFDPKRNCNSEIKRLGNSIMHSSEERKRFREFLISNDKLEDYNAPTTTDDQRAEIEKRWVNGRHHKTSSEILQEKMKECTEVETKNEKKRYFRNEKENIIDGLVMVFIAFFLWLFGRRKDKK